jgi:hypothetical protein
MRALAVAAVILIGCDSTEGSLSGPHPRLEGTVASVSPGTGAHALLLAALWMNDDEPRIRLEASEVVSLGAVPTLPASFALTLNEPTRFDLDFDAWRARPLCGAVGVSGDCWDDREPRPKGQGKLAVGTFAVFEDSNDDRLIAHVPPWEPVRGRSENFFVYVKELDAEGAVELSRRFVLNPQALVPGFNLARIRCRAKLPGWKGSNDPLEIVAAAPLAIESVESYAGRVNSGEICTAR